GVIAKSQRTQRLPAVPGSLATIGQDVNGSVPRFPGATTNVVILDNAASGVGAMNWFPEHDQILRRVPLFVRISDQLYPSLGAEALRLYSKSKTIQVRFSQGGEMAVRIGDTVIPTDRDGQMWLWFSRRDPKRSLSAADVLSGRAPKSEIEN